MADVKCVVEETAELGEGPLWSPDEQVLYWIDILGKRVHRFDPDSKTNRTVQLDDTPTALLLRKNGGLMCLVSKQVCFFDFDLGKLTPYCAVESDLPDNRFNDAKCDRRGRLWAGTMNRRDPRKATGSLYCIASRQKITRHQTEIPCSNGLGWSPDDKTFYFTETFRKAIYAFDFDLKTGMLSNRRVFASRKERNAAFDGLTVDAEGCVWSAISGIGRVIRYRPDGNIDQEIPFPVPRPSSCIFGGKQLRTLFVTTAREILTAEDLERFPLSGSLFAIQTATQGIREPYFQEES